MSDYKEKTTNLVAEVKRREMVNLFSPFPFYCTDAINDLKKIIEIMRVTRTDDFNNVPVHYCKTCLGLGLKDVKFPNKTETQSVVTYCISCGNTDTDTAHIGLWEELYEEKYGKKFLDTNEEE